MLYAFQHNNNLAYICILHLINVFVKVHLLTFIHTLEVQGTLSPDGARGRASGGCKSGSPLTFSPQSRPQAYKHNDEPMSVSFLVKNEFSAVDLTFQQTSVF
jgi:hypothetical protein